jgi:hypothetical protein
MLDGRITADSGTPGSGTPGSGTPGGEPTAVSPRGRPGGPAGVIRRGRSAVFFCAAS